MNDKVKRCSIYCRISTSDKGQDVNLQLIPLRDFCNARGWQIAGEFIDIGVSGSKDSRIELNRLMDDAHKRKTDCIIVWKLDRWGRSLKHLINSIGELQALGIGFVSYQENIDLTTPAGKMMFHVIGAMAEFERELIRERVVAGIANARRKGTKVGRKAIAPIMADKMLELRNEGLSMREIASRLKVSLGAVHKTLLKSA